MQSITPNGPFTDQLSYLHLNTDLRLLLSFQKINNIASYFNIRGRQQGKSVSTDDFYPGVVSMISWMEK